ncbi:MAG: hypothetical protein J5824_01655 [Lachnospiraceae bacterium]|nr:hypothetical protein [Lachnospiraceae bacterium]
MNTLESILYLLEEMSEEAQSRVLEIAKEEFVSQPFVMKLSCPKCGYRFEKFKCPNCGLDVKNDSIQCVGAKMSSQIGYITKYIYNCGVYKTEAARILDPKKEQAKEKRNKEMSVLQQLNIQDENKQKELSLIRDFAAAFIVSRMISELGEVRNTKEYKDDLLEARKTYDLLTDKQKSYVKNSEQLRKAEIKYRLLETQETKTDKQKLNWKDRGEAIRVSRMIYEAGLGKVSYTKEFKDLLKRLRDAYDALPDDKKTYVEYYPWLTAAEMEYERLERDNKRRK